MKKWMRFWVCMLLVMALLIGCSDDIPQEPEGGASPTGTISQGGTPGPTDRPMQEPEYPEGVDEETLLKEQTAFDEFLTRIFVEFAQDFDSVSLHFILQNPEKYGLEVETDLGETETDAEAYAEQCERWLEELEGYEYTYLTASQRVNYDRLVYEMNLAIDSKDLKPCFSTLLSINNNAISGISTCITEYPLLEEKDIEELFNTLQAIPEYLQLVIETVQEQCAEGILPTQYMLEESIEYARQLTSVEDHPFVAAIESNLDEVAGITENDKKTYVAQVSTIVEDELIPALKEYMSCLEDLEDIVAEPQGMAHMEGGKDYYEYLVQGYTGSDMTMPEMYEYLEKKLEKTLANYTAILMFDPGAIDDYFEASYDYSAQEMMLQLKERIAGEFPAIRDTSYQLSFLPEALQIDGVLAYFLTPQIDNPDRKVVRVNPSAAESSVMLYSTLAHEGYPGHLYQDEYFTSLEGYHPINALFSYLGYTEGWATMVGDKAYGWCLDSEAVAEMFRFDYNYSMTLAGLVDIGVNYYGWGLDEVHEYLASHMLDDEALAEEFLNMVVADPGVYLPYMFGFFYCSDIIDALQDQRGLTEREAYRDFLTVGPASFDVLEKHLGISMQ